jgi:putative aldouronate transport system substrate-binding protein
MRLKKLLGMAMVTVVAVSCFSACNQAEKNAVEGENITLRFLDCWQGESAISPEDLTNNPVAKVIREKTGVTLSPEFITTSEIEKLNVLFTSGDMPDLISAPFWGGNDAATQLIKRAAKEGLLTPLDELVNKHGPNVKPAMEGVAATKDLREFDLEDPDFEGKHYFLLAQAKMIDSPDDVTNDAKTLYMRKDIYEALNVDPEKIKTSDDIYELLKKIKEGGFKDINGRDVIPAGSWHSGYLLGLLYTSYIDSVNNMTNYGLSDGKVVEDTFEPLTEQRVLFMRKLISEGLLDVEAFSQNSARATEKLSTGQVGIIGSRYTQLRDTLGSTLYVTNPEMEYIPLPYLLDAKGRKGFVSLKGTSGGSVLILPNTNKHPEATIKVLDYINSEEGMKLISYGIEGEHYNMVDGKPRLTAEWLDKYKSDTKNLSKEGIRSIYDRLLLINNRLKDYGESLPGQADEVDPKYEYAKSLCPFGGFVEGIRLNYFESTYPDIDKVKSLRSSSKVNDTLNKAYFKDSDEEALAVIRELKEQMYKDGEIEKLLDYLTEQIKNRDDILY